MGIINRRDKMEETTKKFERFPPISGVTFSGNEKTAIESRLVIEEEITDFINYCRVDADGVAARFILGDWGEGKTDTYERLIKPEITSAGDYLFFLSASRLSNSYDNETIMNFAKFSLSEPDRLLIHLFNVIKAGAETKDLLPDMKKNPKSFLNDALEGLLENNDKNIFIFIDEFEELLLSPKTLKKVISGIKEAINGDFEAESLHKNKGKYKDRLHFFVSCTPDAYYKIQVTYDFIMPGFDRRVRKIRLTQITREEGLNFLIDLLNYSYTLEDGQNSKLPKKLPITNVALFNTILRVSQRNMGNLTSLFTEIFKSLVKNGQLEILDYSKLLYLLKKYEITAYGGQTPCIDKNYDRIIKYLNETSRTNDGENCKEIFKLIIGELRPIPKKEVCKTISIDKNRVPKLINVINNEIKDNDKIECPIIKVAPLSDDKNIDDLISCLKNQDYIDNEEKNFSISSIKFSEPLEEFKERIIFYELNDDAELIPRVFLPINEADTNALFDELIGIDGASELNNIFEKLISKETAYLANESLLNLIYPTPIPLDTAYLTNEDEKLKLWRYLSHNLNEEYEKNILEAFKIFLNESKMFGISEEDSSIKLTVPEMSTTINTRILVVNGDVKVQDIKDANEIIKNDYTTNLVLILYNGEFSSDADKTLSIHRLGPEDKYQVMGIPLHHSLAKKLLFGNLAVKKFKEYIDEDLFEGVCREKIEELNLKTRIHDWLEYQVKKGLVINQIKLKESPNAKTFADGLKLYLNYDGEHTPEEIYNLNMEGVLFFKKYGSGGFIASDYEDSPNTLTKASSDLKANGFLTEKEGKYCVKTHPVENRIYEIIKNKGNKVSLNDLKSYFINRDRNERVFKDVFINLINYKGFIKDYAGENPSFEINDLKSALEKLRVLFEEYKNNVNDDNLRRFGHFYVKKQRASKLILIEEFDEFITTIHNEAQSSNDLLKINICTKILENFNKNFLVAITEASKAAPEIINEINKIKSDLDQSIDEVINKSVLWLKYKFSRNDIVEYRGLSEDIDEINDLYLKKFSKDDLLMEIKNIESKFKRNYPEEYVEKLLEIFGFRKGNTTKPYYNIKIYLLEQKKKKIANKSSEINNNLDKIKTKFDEIGDRQTELEKRLEATKNSVLEENKIAFFMYKQLENAKIMPKNTIKPTTGSIDLQSLLKSSEESITAIGDRIRLVIKYTDLIENLNDAETNFLTNLKQKKDYYEIYKENGDTKNFEYDLNVLEKLIKELQSNYNDIDMEEIKKDLKKRKKLVQILEDWSKLLDIKSEAVSIEWRDYQKNNRSSIDKIGKTIDILEMKENINKDKIALIMFGIKKLEKNTKVDILDSEFTAKELDSMKEDINKQALSFIGDYLEENERQLLLNLESIKSKWVTLDEIQGGPYRKRLFKTWFFIDAMISNVI